MRGSSQRSTGAAHQSRIAHCLGVGAVLASVLGCLDLREPGAGPTVTEDACSGCHGDSGRRAESLITLAPPNDIKGNHDIEYPGVGAHTLHLVPRAGYAPVTCEQCHVVPTEVRQPGHIDSAPPAEVDFTELPKLAQASDPHYDSAARTCQNTICHGASSGTWTHPRSSSAACGSCHGLPPPSPHPQSDACSTCHGDVIAADGSWLAPHLHVNQRVEVADPACNSCHGSALNPAPPRALDGSAHGDSPGVGAHQAHLVSSLGRALDCSECHTVPATPIEPGHLDGSGVDVTLTGVAQANRREPTWDAQARTCAETWCHSPSDPALASPEWSHTGPLTCNGCHGMPPAAPHPQVTNCNLCHAPVAGNDPGELITSRHVDGVVDLSISDDCSTCHGGPDNSAPPRDTRGNTDSALRSIGAHQAHLVGRGLARVLECGECHLVPVAVSSEGHIDDLVADPAEVIFSGVGTAFLAQPRYESGSCAQTFCHGDSFIAGGSGGSHTIPEWNVTDGSQVRCTSCHGMPPPAPHPQDGVGDCAQCHRNMGSDGSFTHPERHVDGIITFFLDRGDQLAP